MAHPEVTPRRRRSDAPWWAKTLVTLGILVGLSVMVGGVLTSNTRADQLVGAVCDMARSVQDVAAQQRAQVAQLRRQGDQYAAGIAVLTASSAAEQAEREQELADLLRRQQAEVDQATDGPDLSPEVRRLCGVPSTP